VSVVIPSGRLCENSVHGSTKLTTNAVVSLKIEYLSVCPEQRRRAPREFSHSLAERRIFPLLSRPLVALPTQNESLPWHMGFLREQS
jgi:hypothetical protein